MYIHHQWSKHDIELFNGKSLDDRARFLTALDMTMRTMADYFDGGSRGSQTKFAQQLGIMKDTAKAFGLVHFAHYLSPERDSLINQGQPLTLREEMDMYENMGNLTKQLHGQYNFAQCGTIEPFHPRDTKQAPETEVGKALHAALREAQSELKRVFGKPRYDREALAASLAAYLETIPYHQQYNLHTYATSNPLQRVFGDVSPVYISDEVQDTLGEFMSIGRVRELVSACLERTPTELKLVTDPATILARLDYRPEPARARG